MFSIEQTISTRSSGSAKKPPEYVRAPKAPGIEPPVHEVLAVAETSQRDRFLRYLRRHEQRQTKYLEMSMGQRRAG
jgi:hypothetical protein